MSEHVDFELQIDLGEVDAWGGESGPVVPAGVYDLEVISAAQGESTKQQPVIKLEFRILNEGPHYDKIIKKSYSLQKQSLGRVKNLMIACGARLDAIRGSELVNKQLVAEYVHRQGDPQVGPDGNMSEGKMFGDLMNERAVEGAEATTAAPAPAPAPVAQAQANKADAVRRAVGAVRRAVGAAKPS